MNTTRQRRQWPGPGVGGAAGILSRGLRLGALVPGLTAPAAAAVQTPAHVNCGSFLVLMHAGSPGPVDCVESGPPKWVDGCLAGLRRSER